MLKSATGQGISRRSFLKTTAVTAAGVAALGGLAGCSSGEEAPEGGDAVTPVEETKVFQSCMGNCSGWGCPFYVTVRDGKVANITKPGLKCPDGSPSPYQEVCLKGYANIERMYSPTRVQYPMKRAGERGAGQWEQLTWEQAVTEITDKWKQLQADHGNDAVAFFSGSGTNMATVSYTGRLKALMGAMAITPCYDNTGMWCQWDHAGFHSHTNGQNEHRDILNAENIFIWGTNPSESNIVDYHFIAQAKEKGAKVICIDPIYTTSASKADMFVPIRPATDGLLCAGMAQIAIRDGFLDKAHLQTHTVGPFLVKEDGLYLRLSDLGQAEAGSADDRICVWEGGQPVAFDAATDPEIEGKFEVDGIGAVQPACQILLDRINAWDLETIAEYTEVPVEKIEELSGIYTSGLSMIITGYGPDHYSNGQTAYEGFNFLCDLFGQECKHGAGISCTDFSSPTSQGVVNVSTLDLTDVQPTKTIHAPHFHELMEKGVYGDVTVAPKSAYIYMCNPIPNCPDRQKMLKSLGAMEMVVVADMFMSETAQYADYVLPVAFLFERSDISNGQNPFVKLMEKAVDPICDAKGDFEIITELGKAMGFEDKFTMTCDEFLAACVTNDGAAAAGITWERLQEENAIWSYPEEPVVIGLTTPPYTATGRMEFYHEGIQPMHNVGQEWDMKKESAWFWEPPFEAWHETEAAKKYPLLLISERSKFKTHTMFNNAPMILELDPEPYVKMNQADADAYGIAEGDIIRVWNDRGYVVIKATINSGCRPGVMVIDHGWEENGYIEGHYSDLSSCYSWPRYEQDNWFDCQVTMEKVQ